MTETGTSQALPEAGDWNIDPSHTSVEFVARHLMVTKVRGRFKGVSGSLHIVDPIEDSTIEIDIDAASIDTREDDRDTHLRSADFLDVETHPTLTFRSTQIRRVGDNRAEIDGDLTIRDMTRPVTLDTAFHGVMTDPWGQRKAAFTAETEIDREQWGVNWNQALETGGVLVSQRVKVEIEVQAAQAS